MVAHRCLGALLAITSMAAIAAPAAAQYPAAPQPTPDADALAAAMRQIGANPRDLAALITAGELSLRLGDISGAAALFRRAEQIDPMNARVKAGMARILVTQERPGEALRYFDQAIGYGLDVASFAGDRGLAYDLIGEQERAQRDYRLALKRADSDEVRRRYALSLGISNKRDQALEEIDALLRRNDRGAWRARAFILAMTGDIAGANRIATGMMPPGMAQGLQPFFVRLPTLSAVDRAFAVHFGEVGPTAERVADARLTPALPALGPDPDARVEVAAAPPPAPARKDRRSRRDRRARDAAPVVQVAAAAPKVEPLPPPPGFGAPGSAPTDPVPSTPAAAPPPVQVAAVTPRSTPVRTDLDRNDPVGAIRYARSAPPLSSPAAQPTALRPVPAAATPLVPAPVSAAASASPAPAPGPTAAAAMPAPSASVPVEVASVPSGGASAESPPVVATTSAAPPPSIAAASASPAPTVASSATPVPPHMSEDSILARIINGITIPGYELGVGPPSAAVAAAPAAPPEPVKVAAEPAPRQRAPVKVAAAEPAPKPVARATESKVAARDETAPTAKPRRGPATKGADIEPDADALPTKGKRGARGAKADTTDDSPVPDRKALAAKRAADDKKAAAAKKAAEEKALAAKKAADEKKAARAEPSRIWVQVAGGANEGDLPKAWSAVKSKSPALSGRAAYSTPLRATNRVVTGPFKTDAEARAFINQLAKQGISAFPFTSSAGQKMTKLPPK